MNLYGPISVKPFADCDIDFCNRILSFDPTFIYKNIKLEPKKRYQPFMFIDQMFPNPEPWLCACGCGQKLTGRRTRWATNECSRFAMYIQRILCGDSEYLRMIMRWYLPFECVTCGKGDYQIERTTTTPSGIDYISFSASGIHVEHIIPIMDGGGGCWLGNLQFMCHKCHGKKTAQEKLARNKQAPMPISKLF